MKLAILIQNDDDDDEHENESNLCVVTCITKVRI